ncbi:MAG TPA: hypothetical protein VFZ98_04960 [Vicinamibacterales bacterium]
MKLQTMLVALTTGGWLVVAQTPRPAPKPVEPIGAILDAFRDHDVVGLSDGRTHGDEIAMENGNARYQGVMDRYIRGEDVSFAELRHVWDDTTQPQIVNGTDYIHPVYVALRAINAKLARAQQHRAILGDPPIDWAIVHTREEFQRWLEQRDSSGAAMIQREILAKGRKALAIYGGGHLQRKQQASNYKMDHPLAQTVISLLDRAGVKTFVVSTIGERDFVKPWSAPALALVRGTTFGAEVIPQGRLPRVELKPDGTSVQVPRDRWVDLAWEDQIDAVLFLGPDSNLRNRALPQSLCTDPGYLDNRLERMAIAGLPPPEIDRLRKFCGR